MREAAGKSIKETAAHMGVTVGAVSQWEHGLYKPSINKLPKLAAFYGCTIEQLLESEDTA